MHDEKCSSFRSKVLQNTNQALIKINGVNTTQDSRFYMGKRVAYIVKSHANGKEKTRCMWGKVAATHGTNGVVRCIFKTHLPPTAIGKNVYVMLYPSRV